MSCSYLSRRQVLIAASVFVAGCALGRQERKTFQNIESELGGRIGLSVLNTVSGRRVAYRGAERFALCSTFKAPLAAAVLNQIDADVISPFSVIDLKKEKLLTNSPVSAKHTEAGQMSVIAACEAAVSYSDNTAANSLLRLIGGPDGMTRFFRQLGDHATRLDRYELELNSNIAGDARDTTTPDAIAASVRTILLGDTLTPTSRDLLTNWMLNEQRGRARIRAGVPAHWRVANKPGTSTNGATNDIAVAWTAQREPIVMAIYVNAPSASNAEREAAIARIARISSEHVARD
jgi:beta-lactamase class A